MRHRTNWIALIALVFLFAACKGESPTSPNPGSGGTPGDGGTTPPPSGINVVLTASNTEPSVDGTVTITATVTQNGAPAPNGTAVEFSTTAGGFDNTTAQTLLKITNNGTATVQLTSTTAGQAVVRAVVNNVSRSVTITFKTPPVPDVPESTAPTITSVSPTIGRPSGGEIIRITGTNFRQPLRVLFNTGGALPVEATIVSSSLTHIDVITPGVNLGAGQQLQASVIVLTQAGTATEQRAEFTSAFTYRNEQLTPRISTASPNSGPVTGGTRVTIFGDGFQAPVQVLFGAAEARVITVDYNQIIVEAPAGRDTSDTGSGTVVGPVPITVRNINSQTSTSANAAFRYVAAMDITSFSPTVGPSTGGTDIVIDGVGFVAPVEVVVGGVRATVLQVTGTRILARTGPLQSSCSTVAAGSILVTNVSNGDNDTHGDSPDEVAFTYIPVPALITRVEAPAGGAIPGSPLTVFVRDPGVGILGNADIRFSVNDRTIIPSPDRITTGTGVQQFGVSLPLTGFTFPTQQCTIGSATGTRLGPVEVPLTFQNTTSGCQANTTIVVNPPGTNACVAPPVVSSSPSGTTCASPAAPIASAGTASGTATITITNSALAGAQNLVITSATVTGSNGNYTISAPTGPIAPGTSQQFTVTIDPAAAGPLAGTATFATNDPARPTITVCINGSAT